MATEYVMGLEMSGYITAKYAAILYFRHSEEWQANLIHDVAIHTAV